MSKLTKEECEELAEIIGKQTGKIRCDGSASFSFIEIWKYLEQKKKQWQEEAVVEVIEWALKQPDEGGTSFYDYHKALLRFLDDKVLKSIKH